MSELRDRLVRARARMAGRTSDFDLNAALRPADQRALRGAGVLVAVRDTGTVILTKRSSALSQHPGQIAFPGGKVDPCDADATAAALREAWEETALPPGTVDVLGELPGHETVTGFAIVPVLALVRGRVDLRPEAGEVAEIFDVPLAHLADPAQYRVEARTWRGTVRRYYVVPWGPYYIWGATARILRGLAEGLR